MINYLKKNFFRIIGVLVLAAIVLYFIPAGEGHYLQPDYETARSGAHHIFRWIVIALSIVLFLLNLKGVKKIADFFFLVFAVAVIGFSSFFFFDSVFYTATLAVNRASGKNTEKTYVAQYVNTKDQNLLLWDNNLKKGIWSDALLKTNNTSIAAHDTVIVSFSKGLLGYNYNPVIKAIKSAAGTDPTSGATH